MTAPPTAPSFRAKPFISIRRICVVYARGPWHAISSSTLKDAR